MIFPGSETSDCTDDCTSALADAGLFGLAGPVSHGGLDLDAHAARRAMAAVGSGCGATFFVWVQHHGVVGALRRRSPTSVGPVGRQMELRSRWTLDDELVRALAGGEDAVVDASNHRAACLDLARRSTTALLAGVGGRGMDLSHPAQRLAREADFYVIQAQTADGRAATLRSVAILPMTSPTTD